MNSRVQNAARCWFRLQQIFSNESSMVLTLLWAVPFREEHRVSSSSSDAVVVVICYS